MENIVYFGMGRLSDIKMLVLLQLTYQIPQFPKGMFWQSNVKKVNFGENIKIMSEEFL